MGHKFRTGNVDKAHNLGEVHGHANLDWFASWRRNTVAEVGGDHGIDVDSGTHLIGGRLGGGCWLADRAAVITVDIAVVIAVAARGGNQSEDREHCDQSLEFHRSVPHRYGHGYDR